MFEVRFSSQMHHILLPVDQPEPRLSISLPRCFLFHFTRIPFRSTLPNLSLRSVNIFFLIFIFSSLYLSIQLLSVAYLTYGSKLCFSLFRRFNSVQFHRSTANMVSLIVSYSLHLNYLYH